MSGQISRNLYDAIAMVESGALSGMEYVTGDGGSAYGPYQIHKNYWIDASEKDPSLKADGKTWDNTKGPGSYEYSEKVMQAYMNRYATCSRLGHEPTDEDIARIHNGGPDGYKRKATDDYWKKVEKHLQS